MAEIIHLQIGQCGNKAGEQFWDTISQEHGIQADGVSAQGSFPQLERIWTYYEEKAYGKYIPRAILVDTNPGTMGSILSGKIGGLFPIDNFIMGRDCPAGDVWRRAYSGGEDSELTDAVLDLVRRKVEGSDWLQGFQLLHAMSGVAGGGLGALVLSRVREEYPDRSIATFSVLPHSSDSLAYHTVVSPYNTLLSFHHLSSTADVTFCINNQTLQASCGTQPAARQLGQLNQMISSALSGLTASLRFPSMLNGNLGKLTTNMVTLPRLHFLTCGFVPASASGIGGRCDDPSQLIDRMLNASSMVTTSDIRDGRYLTFSSIIRHPKVLMGEVEKKLSLLDGRDGTPFLSQNAESIFTSGCVTPAQRTVDFSWDAAHFGNSTSIMGLLKRVDAEFLFMFQRKAFLHWYTQEGMDEEEFIEAQSCVQDLVSAYKGCESSSEA